MVIGTAGPLSSKWTGATVVQQAPGVARSRRELELELAGGSEKRTATLELNSANHYTPMAESAAEFAAEAEVHRAELHGASDFIVGGIQAPHGVTRIRIPP